MKKNIFTVFLFSCILVSAVKISAAPYTSYMIDRDGNYRWSPTLYEPSHIIDFDISGVNDMFIDGKDRIYIARSTGTGLGNSQILVFDSEENFLMSAGDGELRGAQGVFVDDDGRIYVADDIESVVVVFSPEGKLIKKIARPVSALFGINTPFKPLKLVVDKAGNLYILGEGSTNGIIQLDPDGEFIGFFGVSDTRISLIRRLQNFLFPPELMANFMRTRPSSMTNIAIDSEGIVYTVTSGETTEPLRKINIAGRNLLDDSLRFLYGGEPLSLESVTTDRYGNIFTVSSLTGHIIILNSIGEIIGIFGARNEHSAGLGLTVNPVSIAVNSSQIVYVADRGLGQIQVFTPTPLMSTLFSALDYYREGRYTESENLWRDALMRNSIIAVANNAIALSYMKKEEFNDAEKYFRLANNRIEYSSAFWEIRQLFLLLYLPYAIIAILIFVFFGIVWSQIHKRTKLLNGYYGVKERFKKTFFMVKLREVTLVFRHPVDAYYNVSYEGAVSIPTAVILTVLSAGLLLFSDYGTGFIFNMINTEAGYMYSPFRTLTVYSGVFGLFILSNFLIASITDGHGSLKQIFRASALALAPIAFFYLPLIALSNVLTLQEVFIFKLARAVIFGWSGLLIIIMVMQIHDFDFSAAIWNIILTLFTMSVIFVVVMVIYMLSRSAVTFFYSMFEEMYNRG